MKLIKKLATLVVVCALQACVSAPQYTPMTQEKADKIESNDAYVFVHQDEIRPSVTLSNATGALGGGLIGAAIDSSVNDDRAANAMDLTMPLYRQISDFDYRKVLMDRLNPILTSELRMSQEKISADVSLTNDKALKDKVKKLKPGESYLHSHVYYQFADDSKIIQTTYTVFLFLPNAKPSITKPDYYNIFHFQSNPVGDGGGDSISKWSDNNAELFRKEMTQSAEFIADTLKYDLQVSLSETCLRSGQVRIWNSLGGFKSTGNVISEDNGRALLRLSSSQLMSTHNGAIVDKKSKDCKTQEAGVK